MAMVSPRLQHDIDRRIRAAYSLDVDRGLRGDTHRSSSVPAALRHHRGQEPNRAMTAPAGYRGRRGSTARPRLIFLDKHVRTARSVSPPSKQRRHVERPRARSPLITEPVASVLGDEVPLTSEDGSSGTGAEDESVGGPGMAADEKAGSGDKEGTVASDFGAPKLMELMEERDRAVHLCLQYRCKLKNTEGSLRAEERLASDLKSQLREANAAGEATRNLFDQVMDRVRADEGRQLRQGTSTRQDEKQSIRFAEEARKTRLQLVRARKDLRELWLERDELAMLAGQAIQGEQASCKRVKKLELAVAGLREQVAALALSEEKAAEKTARAEARATAAEAAESELRKAVETIKDDFEALVRDLRQREKTIRQLEAKNATLDVKSVALAPAPHGRVLERSSSADTRLPAEGNRPAALPPRRVSSQDQVGAKAAQGLAFRDSRAWSVDRPTTGGVLDTRENGARGTAAPNPHSTGLDQTRTTANVPVASTARPARKKLTPQASEVPGRVTTISYPRCGSRATFTPVAAPETASERGKASGSMTSLRQEDVVKKEEETSASPALCRSAEKVPCDIGNIGHLGRSARPNETQDKKRQLGTCELQAQPSPRQQPIQQTKSSFDDSLSPSSQEARQPPCPLTEKALPNDHPRSCEVKVPDAHVNPGTGIGDAQDIGGDGGGGGGGGGDRAVQSEGREGAEAERRASSSGLVDGVRATVAPTRPSTAAGNAEPDCAKSLPSNEQAGVEHEEGHEVEVEPPVSLTLDEIGKESETPAFRSRLVDGVPVMKYGGGKGKPKPKVLWVTPDLSEIFYTQTGRTKNSKKSSHMPLAGLCASKGRRDCPDLLRAAAADRCFALVQADERDEGGGGHPDQDDGTERNGGGDSPGPGRRKWGIGGTLPANLVHGKRWRGGAEAGVRVGGATTGGLTASSSPGRARARLPAAAAGRSVKTRERMGLETTSAEECTALVDEINELVRRAGMKHGGGGSSSRGRELFDDWVRSAEARRDADVGAEAPESSNSAEVARNAPDDIHQQ